MWGRHHTPETKAKIGNANRGRPSPMKGKKFGPAPEERRLKQSIAHAGKKRTPFTCPKRRGVPRSEETKEKIRVTLTGKMAGKSNPNYRNGASFLPYCEKFNEYHCGTKILSAGCHAGQPYYIGYDCLGNQLKTAISRAELAERERDIALDVVSKIEAALEVMGIEVDINSESEAEG